MKATNPPAAPSPGAASIGEEGGPRDLSLTRTYEPSGMIDATERKAAGLEGQGLPASVTWLQLDGTRASDALNGQGMAWREDPDSREQYKLIERTPPVDPVPWLESNAPDTTGELWRLLKLYYPGQNGRIVRPMPAPVWRAFQRERDCLLDKQGATQDMLASIFAEAIRQDAESLRQRQVAVCGTRTMVGLYREKEGAGWTSPRVDMRRWRCKSWTCPHCSRRLQYEAGEKLASALAVLKGHRMPIFATFTLDPRAVGKSWHSVSARALPILSWKLIRANWKALLRSLRRRYGDLQYAMRVEGHRSGWAHLHAAICAPQWYGELLCEERFSPKSRPGKKWLEKAAVRAGYGPICDVQRVDCPRSTAWYLSKASAIAPPGRGHSGTPMRGATDALAGEISKGRQLRSVLLPRGTRTLEQSRGFWPLCREEGWTEREAPAEHVERLYSSVGMCDASLDYLSDVRGHEHSHLIGVIDRAEHGVRDWIAGAESEGQGAPRKLEWIREEVAPLHAQTHKED